MIRRAFADLADRQVHYRHGGPPDTPLLMIHASPGSSKQLEPLLAALAETRRVIAPDTPGNGDSPPLTLSQPEIGDYADALLQFMDAIQLEAADVYGSHTGAAIAAELAIRAPDRVRKLVMNGIGVFTPQEQAEYVAHYALERRPDIGGGYLTEAFLFCRDQYIFFPWYARDAAHSRGGGLPRPEALHDWLVEVLKALTTYHLAYRASFRYLAQDRLDQVRHETLAVVHDSDPLLRHTQWAADLLPRATWACLPTPSSDAGSLAEAINAFLGGPGA